MFPDDKIRSASTVELDSEDVRQGICGETS